MRALSILLAIVVLALAPPGAWPAEGVPTELDRVQQKRAVELSENLRCLVCQNQTIADSNAELAQDLRRQVREQIAQGRSDKEIVAYMVQRYGDFVLYNPPVKATTLLLWFGPGLLLLAGLLLLVLAVRARAREPAQVRLSEGELERARSLLGDDGGGKGAA